MSSIKSPASAKTGAAATTADLDVCKIPAPPAPFAPAPYPNSQLQENLKKANRIDGQASTGNKKAIAQQKKAIDSLKKAAGDETGIKSATAAVHMGHTLHKGAVGKPSEGKETAIAMGLSKHPSALSRKKPDSK